MRRYAFFADSPLQWRPLIPVMCELVRRGHHCTAVTSRAEWRGMPWFRMAFRPQVVISINRQVLAWCARIIGFAAEWEEAQRSIDYQRYLVPEEYDAAVGTTKQIPRLRNLGEGINNCTEGFAIGIQHLPIVMRLNSGPFTYFDIPKPLWPPHPFADLHGFEDIYCYGTGRSCGFPHLDKVRIPLIRKRNAVLIQHHGGYRGIRGHVWLREIVRAINKAGYEALICPHFIPGYGYDRYAIIKALDRTNPNGNWRTVKHWWGAVDQCDLILTTGSSAAYEMWAVGLTNVFILGYVGGTRHQKFAMFDDLIVKSPQQLRSILLEVQRRGLPGGSAAVNPLTREVMEAFRGVHNWRGAKTAADVIEGKL